MNAGKVVKSDGVNDSERLLADLCEKSFLKLWSYPNSFKDDRKELCDLLAVFENHVFIFFDRENQQLENPDKDPEVLWRRWKKRVIDDQARTAHGAEKYIRSGRPIFLDKDSNMPFPLKFNPETAVIHKIIIAHGAVDACKRHSDKNIFGSLGISYSDILENDLETPFIVTIDRGNPVHVFDSHNLPVVFGELDTFYEFSVYLDEKIRAIKSLYLLSYCGEEDLLAHYLLNFDDKQNRHFIGVKCEVVNGLTIGEGAWNDLLQHENYHNKKMADEVSYMWDELLQRTCQNELDGTLLGDGLILSGCSAIHEMAKEPRFMRRALSQNMINAIQSFPEGSGLFVRKMSFMPSYYENKAYVFLQLKFDDIKDFESEIRPGRQKMLEIACAAAKEKFSHLTVIVGIAINAPKFHRENSEDFLLLDCSDWSEEQSQHYKDLNQYFGFFQSESLVSVERRIQEFPSSRDVFG